MVAATTASATRNPTVGYGAKGAKPNASTATPKPTAAQPCILAIAGVTSTTGQRSRPVIQEGNAACEIVKMPPATIAAAMR